MVAYDFSGMGDSGVRDEYPDEVRLQELMDVAWETGLFENGHKPTIIAHSYGGSVGLIAMERCHDKFSRLVICDLMTLRPQRLKAQYRFARALVGTGRANRQCTWPTGDCLWGGECIVRCRFCRLCP